MSTGCVKDDAGKVRIIIHDFFPFGKPFFLVYIVNNLSIVLELFAGCLRKAGPV